MGWGQVGVWAPALDLRQLASPSAAFKYGEEEQQAYTDTNGIRITGQTASLGRLSSGLSSAIAGISPVAP